MRVRVGNRVKGDLAHAAGAHAQREFVGRVRRTQVGLARPAHQIMPISGKPEIGAP
jgi:hypothetical protein